jgi:hypothetical protein
MTRPKRLRAGGGGGGKEKAEKKWRGNGWVRSRLKFGRV